jgi:hypothetical protein
MAGVKRSTYYTWQNGVIIGEYKGVRVGVIKTNGE